MSSFARFLNDEEAATAVEYSVMLAMIVLVAIAAISGFGGKTSGLWDTIVGGLLSNGM
jgi:pilus assembly protein Flp/PilA